MHIKSLKSVFWSANYRATINYFQEKSDEINIDSVISTKAEGFWKTLLTFEFYFMLSIINIVFDHIEILNQELQKKELSVIDSHASVQAVMENLKTMRSETIFSEIWKDITKAAETLGVEMPILKRQKKHLNVMSILQTIIYIFFQLQKNITGRHILK